MDRNFVLALALSFMVIALWSAYTAPPPIEPGENLPQGEYVAPEAEPSLSDSLAASGSPFEARAEPAEAAPPEPGEIIQIQTSLFRAELSTRGAGLVGWELAEYHDATALGEPPIDLVTTKRGREVALATPFADLGRGDFGRAPFVVESSDARSVVFRHSEGGVTVRKTYRFEDDTYTLRLLLEVENESDHPVSPTFRTLWPARRGHGEDFLEQSLVAYVDGDLQQLFVRGSPSFFGRSDDRSFDTAEQWVGDTSWAGVGTKYFVSAMIPDRATDAAVRLSPLDFDEGLTELAFNPVNVPPGQRAARELRVYIGPKDPQQLEPLGAHMDEAVYKGWFPPLTNFFLWLLTATHSVVGNYGVAIVLITILVRLLLAPIMAKQVKSMKRMGELQPKIKAVQEQYADDKTKQSEEMMKIYRESGFNPAAGCLPMFLQLPIFLGLYYALQGSILLRQEPFFGWINDLSAPETLFVIPGLELPVRLLPLLMGGSMVVQQRLTPTTMDPAQARMMNTVLPAMFTLLFYQFASGLVLYWLISNVLGIAQQVWTTGGPSPNAAAAATETPAKGGAAARADARKA